MQASNELIQQIIKLQNSLLTEAEKKILQDLIIAYESIENELRVFVSKYGIKGVMPEAAKVAQYNRLNNLLTSLEENINNILKRIDYQLQKSTVLGYQQLYYQYMYTNSMTAGLNLYFGIVNETTILAAINYPLSKLANSKLLANARAETIEKIKQAIKQGIIRGESVDNVSANIARLLGLFQTQVGQLVGIDAGKLYQLQRVARTEMMRIFNQAAVDEMLKSNEMGLKTRLQLLSTIDDRTRPQSAQMDGQISNEKGEFKYPDGSYYKIGQTGNPAWDINDRETTVPYLGEIMGETRKKFGKIDDYETFSEYAKRNNINFNKYGQELYTKS